jgi:hypothetical protein
MTLVLVVALASRLVIGHYFDLGIYIVVWSELALLIGLLYLTIPSVRLNKEMYVQN